MNFRTTLKSTTVIPALVGAAGLAVTVTIGAFAMEPSATSGVENMAAVSALAATEAVMGKKMKKGCNPCAAENPCAAQEGCGGCNPCNPCAAENPCAAQKGCGGCNPCNPCAASNPCAAGGCGGCNPCNPCAASNPCAAGGCGGCNPCNPCAASNPCGACNACNPCNPCAGGGGGGEVSDADAAAGYARIKAKIAATFAGADDPAGAAYQGWTRYNTVPYLSATHGGRLVNNYANDVASAYGRFEDAGEMPVGAVVAKDSLFLNGDGSARMGPLFLMEKMAAGFDSENGNWKYTIVTPNGTTMGVTNGKNSPGVKFCADCHAAVPDQDYLFYLPAEYRK